MKTRILFLDDEPQTCGRLKVALEERGYHISVPKTLSEALHEINVNKAELLIHSAHRTETHWEVCRGIFENYPQFPTLHFATGPVSEAHDAPMKGAFHQKLRPLIPEKDFLKRVRKMIFLGRLKRENEALRKAMILQNSMDKVFDTLDIQELKRRIVDFFGREFKAKNAFYLSPGGYGHFLQEMWKVSSLSGVQDSVRFHKHALVSAQPSSELELSHIFSKISEQLPTGWELKPKRTYIENNNLSYCFIPLLGHQSNAIQGYIFLVEPLLYGDLALEKIFGHLTRVLGRHLEHALTFTDAKSLSYVDDLTDLYNQRYLKLVLEKEINRSKRSKACFSVLFMDIDHFKQVNDTKGHVVGSQVLVELSKILHENIRTMDYGFRYGGDEFLLILVGTDSKNAIAVAERIRKQVEQSVFNVDGEKIRVTLSIGIATFPEHATTKEQIIELADRAMYCGKNQSRNVVYVAS